MTDAERRVREFYGFDFPADFFRVAERLPTLPPGALGRACDMHPAFPFEVAAGRPARDFPDRPEWQDRYYHDLPEFVTIFTGTADGRHWGYFFDAPGERPPVVAHYWHNDTFQHNVPGVTLTDAIRYTLNEDEQGFLEMEAEAEGWGKPDDAKFYRDRLAELRATREALRDLWAGRRSRSARQPTASTWDDMGIMVPARLYVPLSSEPFGRSRADPQRPHIDGLIADARAALAAGKPGAAFKLGRDLWIFAADYPESYELLDAAYAALGREPLRRLLAVARAWREHCDAPRPGGAT